MRFAAETPTCNVDFDDNWKLYGDGFLMDAQVALESAAAPGCWSSLSTRLTTLTWDTGMRRGPEELRRSQRASGITTRGNWLANFAD